MHVRASTLKSRKPASLFALAPFILSALVPAFYSASALDMTKLAANSINSLGIDLLGRMTTPNQAAVVSPYSIQCAMAMTYAGAEGETRTEMARVLHYPSDGDVHRSFSELQQALTQVAANSKRAAEQTQKYAPRDPITFSVANRLYGQQGYDFREPFLTLLTYQAPFEAADFARNAGAVTRQINAWVENQTHQRIRNLIPDRALNELTRLVLVNALYLKAPWEKPFTPSATTPQPFHFTDGKTADVPTMFNQQPLGYAEYQDCTAVTIPYAGNELTLLVLLPKQVDGLTSLQRNLTPAFLEQCTRLATRDVILHLPKFKLEPPTLALGEQLEALGMRSAFDHPRGSANFNGIAPKKPNDYLYVSEIFHKTFISIDEKGTEAAAATAVAVRALTAFLEKPKPVEVRVDHPFIFAIQYRATGACLFLGRLTDPR